MAQWGPLRERRCSDGALSPGCCGLTLSTTAAQLRRPFVSKPIRTRLCGVCWDTHCLHAQSGPIVEPCSNAKASAVSRNLVAKILKASLLD
jgi:hypothetical protein